MHPSERTINAREMRDLLLGSKQPLTPIEMPLSRSQKPSWGKVLEHNRLLIGFVMGLLILATVVSLTPPLFP